MKAFNQIARRIADFRAPCSIMHFGLMLLKKSLILTVYLGTDCLVLLSNLLPYGGFSPWRAGSA